MTNTSSDTCFHSNISPLSWKLRKVGWGKGNGLVLTVFRLTEKVRGLYLQCKIVHYKKEEEEKKEYLVVPSS